MPAIIRKIGRSDTVIPWDRIRTNRKSGDTMPWDSPLKFQLIDSLEGRIEAAYRKKKYIHNARRANLLRLSVSLQYETALCVSAIFRAWSL